MIRGIVSVVFGLWMSLAIAGGEKNLLSNGELTITDGKIADWQLIPELQLETLTDGLPDGLKTATQITISGSSKGDGQLTQRLYPKKGEATILEFSGMMKGSVSRVGYVQVKLYEAKRETSRKTITYSTTSWQPFAYRFDATGMAKIEIICRWRHASKYQDSTVAFAGLKLLPVKTIEGASVTPLPVPAKPAAPVRLQKLPADSGADSAFSGLKNGMLKLNDAGSGVSGWRMTPKLPIAEETSGLPSGLASALRISVDGVREGEGQLAHMVSLTDSMPRAFELSGLMKSEVGRCGYLQVKLYKGKREIGRKNYMYSTTHWQPFTVQIDATGADRVGILLRWRHYERYAGTQLWFGGLELKPVRRVIALAGDSTVQDYPVTSSRRGWGQALTAFTADGVGVANFAAGGKSSKTFRTEGYWKKLLAAKPDVVLIQFGHNDSHEAGRPESTDAAEEFPRLIKGYVNDARAAGIKPVLVTPPHRRVFLRSTGKLATVLAPYAEATRQVAKEMDVICVDLYSYTDKEFSARGSTGSQELFCSNKDRSHFSALGADMLAAYVVQQASAADETLAEMLPGKLETPQNAD